MSKAYFVTIPLLPNDVLELRPFDDGTNRGAIIYDINDDVAHEGWAQSIQCPSKMISISGKICALSSETIIFCIRIQFLRHSGERVSGYTFKSICRMLTKCQLPVRCRLENVTSTKSSMNVSSDSESDAELIRNKSSSRHKKQSSSSLSRRTAYNSYIRPKKATKPKLNYTMSNDSNASDMSIHLSSLKKQCAECSKYLKESKQHRCRRCAAIVCSKCSKNKRKEVGYDKLVRVCDGCIKRDEFTVQIENKPFGIQIGPLHGKTNDNGGIFIQSVKIGYEFERIELNDAGLKFEKTVIIEIGAEKMKNIELMPYNDAIELLRNQKVPIYIRCKRWNAKTKSSAKQQLEREHQQKIKEKLAELQKNENEQKQKKQKEEEKEEIIHSHSHSHHRNGTNSSFGGSDISENESVGLPSFTNHSSYGKPSDMFFESSTNLDRYTGSNDIEQHPANELIAMAEEAETNDDIESAAMYYEQAIKQFNETIHEIDNNKIKRKWKEKVNDYEIQKLRINRKLRLRNKIKSSHLKPKRRANRRSNTMQPIKRRQAKHSVDYTEDIKDDENGDNGDGDTKKKKSKEKNNPDQAFRDRLEGDIVTEAPNISFKDVTGLLNVKLALYECVILPQKRPELFTGLRKPTKGLLLFGPPGNGKTMIAKCVATECDSTFFSISASSITSKYVGEAERIMRTLFNLAREKQPSIIFIDEIDSLLTARGSKNEAESSRRIKTEFLVQFDGVKASADGKEARVLVIGATNLPDQLDEAVLRRFGKRILVPVPDEEARYGILRNLAAKQTNELKEHEFRKIVQRTNLYSASDLAQVCKDASMGPLRDLGSAILDMDENVEVPPIQFKHFESSLKNVRASVKEESLLAYKKWNSKFGSKSTFKISSLPQNMHAHAIEPLQ